MNTTLQPVLQPSAQTPTVPSPNKSMHSQGSPMSYTQPSGPVSQNPYPNTNMAHSHTNAQQNHFNLSMSATGYNMGSIPSSNHPVASLNQAAGVQQSFPAQKTAPFPLHGQNQNTIPPVSQSLPANSVGLPQAQQNQTSVPSVQSQNSTQVSTAAVEPVVEKEKPQANGTPEKAEAQGNHVTPAVAIPVVLSSPSTTEAPQKSPPRPQPPTPAPENPDPPKPPAEDASPPPAADDAVTPDAVPSAPEEPTAETPKEAAPETDPLAIDAPQEEAAASRASDEDDDVAAAAAEEEEEEAVQQGPPAKKESPAGKAAAKTPTRKTKAAKAELKTPVQKSPNAGKVKRQRMMTQHYQSPLPEIEIITKISSSTPRNKNMDDKLIYFYKNEFLAVRNAEGSFYLCQAAQNVYKSSSKIKIRWLSQDKADSTGEIYTPDFYDLTDFDCILTSLDLTRMDKGKYRLKPAEKERTDSILKRCLAVEKGEIVSPSLSEEHPDGLDLSLYKDEEQLKKKRKGTKRKGRPRSTSPKKSTPVKKAPEAAKVRKVEPKAAKKPAAASTAAKKAVVSKAAVAAGESKKAVGRASRGKRKVESKSPVMDQKKAIVLAKIGRSSAVQAGTSRSHSKSAKPSKPVPPTSKATKVSGSAASSSKATSLRKTKRSTRK